MKVFYSMNLLLFLLFSFQKFSFAQTIVEIESKNGYYKNFEINITVQKLQLLKFPFKFTGCSFVISLDESFENFYIVDNNKDTIKISENTAGHQYKGVKKLSNLIIFEKAISEIVVYSGNVSSFEIHLFNAEAGIEPQKKNAASEDSLDCSRPLMIDQQQWRYGLPDPKPNPAYTATSHIVIHHTATSNSNQNYLNTLRTIYLYHIQDNGWDDIGYNFIIAPNGDIYEGRDGQQIMEEDFVQGAHFCSKNSNTMGISIIGTYSSIMPSDTAIESLERLIAWKLFKDHLNPKDSFIHPKASGYLLPVICGHRDGCATECPGDSLYAKLDIIRGRVEEMIHLCKYNSLISVENKEIVVYPNPVFSYVILSLPISISDKTTIKLFDVSGRQLTISNSYFHDKQIILNLEDISSGWYSVLIEDSEKIYHGRILKM